jgi:hypothetical protein
MLLLYNTLYFVLNRWRSGHSEIHDEIPDYYDYEFATL